MKLIVILRFRTGNRFVRVSSGGEVREEESVRARALGRPREISSARYQSTIES